MTLPGLHVGTLGELDLGTLPGLDPGTLGELAHGDVARAGDGDLGRAIAAATVRASFSVHSTTGEVDSLVAGLHRVRMVLGGRRG